MFEFTRPVYGKEANYSENANVLDAIICALMANGLEATGGWDSVNVPNGGYVHSVTPGGIPTGRLPKQSTALNTQSTMVTAGGLRLGRTACLLPRRCMAHPTTLRMA